MLRPLFIDNSSESVSLSAFDSSGELKELVFQSKDQQSEQLSSLFAKLAPDMNIIILNCGPGSYTSLRVGLSFASGLSAGLGAELHGLNGALFQKLKDESKAGVKYFNASFKGPEIRENIMQGSGIELDYSRPFKAVTLADRGLSPF